jgi:hypothetical protein
MPWKKTLGEDPNPLPSTPTTLPGNMVNGWFRMTGTAQAGAAQKIPKRAAWQTRQERPVNPRRHLRIKMDTTVKMSGISHYPCFDV